MELYKSTTVREITFDSYMTTVKLYVYSHPIGDIPINKLRPDLLQQWINDLSRTKHKTDPSKQLSARSVNYARMLVIAALEQACKDGLIIRNPAKNTKPVPKDRRKFQALTRDDQAKFVTSLKESESDYAPMFLFALMTGLRPTEIVGIKWENIDFTGGLIAVTESAMSRDGTTYVSPTKTHAGQRSIPMTTELQKLLKSQGEYCSGLPQNPNNLVFPSCMGTYINKNNIHRALKSEFQKASVPYTSLRGLRHTFGTRAAEAGINPAITQQLMGHSSSQTTFDYYTEAQTDAKLSALEKIMQTKKEE